MIRGYSYLILSKFVYVKVQGLIWVHNGVSNLSNLDINAGNAITEIYNSVSVDIPLVLDFEGIVNITDHSWDSFFKAIPLRKRSLLLLNCAQLEEKITNSRKEFCPDITDNIQNSHRTMSVVTSQVINTKACLSEVEKYLQEKIKHYIEASFKVHENSQMKRLPSTPIYSTGEYNAGIILRNPEQLYWIGLYMAKMISQIIADERLGTPSRPCKLIAVSLRASPLAGIVATFLGQSLETVDHFGPINKGYEIDTEPSVGQEYIYIGDFTAGGTEIKLSKMFVHSRGGKLRHAVVLGSLFEVESFTDFKLYAIVNLKEINKDEASYSLFI